VESTTQARRTSWRLLEPVVPPRRQRGHPSSPREAAPSAAVPDLRFSFRDYALLNALTATENIAVAANLAGTTGPRRPPPGPPSCGTGSASTPDGRPRPSRMSDGEQQRDAMARALAHDPPVLLADERPQAVQSSGTRVTVRISTVRVSTQPSRA
jgi:putative ABC transport system ATP-binding protein